MLRLRLLLQVINMVFDAAPPASAPSSGLGLSSLPATPQPAAPTAPASASTQDRFLQTTSVQSPVPGAASLVQTQHQSPATASSGPSKYTGFGERLFCTLKNEQFFSCLS
jgi:hypothetical protein